MKKFIYSEKFIRFLTLLGPFVIAMDPLDSYSPRNIADNIIGWRILALAFILAIARWLDHKLQK